MFLSSDLQTHVFKRDDYKPKPTGLLVASKGGCRVSGSQAVHGCVHSSVRFLGWHRNRLHHILTLTAVTFYCVCHLIPVDATK